MIDITGINLVEFAKKVYELSAPQGLGKLHYDPNPLTDDEASNFICRPNDLNQDVILDMDYVKGRACKMTVWRKDGKLEIADKWFDHTDKIFIKLLAILEIIPPEEMPEHVIACNCIDCQSKHIVEEDFIEEKKMPVLSAADLESVREGICPDCKEGLVAKSQEGFTIFVTCIKCEAQYSVRVFGSEQPYIERI